MFHAVHDIGVVEAVGRGALALVGMGMQVVAVHMLVHVLAVEWPEARQRRALRRNVSAPIAPHAMLVGDDPERDGGAIVMQRWPRIPPEIRSEILSLSNRAA